MLQVNQFIIAAIMLITISLAGVFFAFWRIALKKLKRSIALFNKRLNVLDQTILHAKKQLEATFDSISDGVAVIDTDYNITRLNKTYAGFVAQTINSALNMKCYSALRNFDKPCPECPVNNPKYHDGFNCKIGNNKYQIEVKGARPMDVIETYIETIRDVTRFDNLHSQLRRSERMATIGTMVAGIAHEMNNPLSGISGNSQLILRTPEKYGMNEKGLDRIQTIAESSERATQIVKELLSFSMPPKTQFKHLVLSSLIESTLEQMDSSEFPEVEIDVSIGPDLKVWGNRKQLLDLMTKLITNAYQAIMEVKKTEQDLEGKIIINAFQEGENIFISISDNGCGIPSKNISDLFDPFYTTREPGSGPGLGLSISHRIVAEHFGSIKLIQLDKGTKVQLLFPSELQEIY